MSSSKEFKTAVKFSVFVVLSVGLLVWLLASAAYGAELDSKCLEKEMLKIAKVPYTKKEPMPPDLLEQFKREEFASAAILLSMEMSKLETLKMILDVIESGKCDSKNRI